MDVPDLPEDFLEKIPNQDSKPPEDKKEGELKDSQPTEGEDQPPKEEPAEAVAIEEGLLSRPEAKKPAKRGRTSGEKEPDKKKTKKDTPKAEKKPRQKTVKPQFVKGVPISSMQCDSHALNPYNFDPMAEVMKLGTGQLQSAYRNSRTIGHPFPNICRLIQNVIPPKEKKIYKLEHKGDGDSVETHPAVEEECETPKKAPVAQRRSFLPDFSQLLPPISVPMSAPATPVPAPATDKVSSSSMAAPMTLLEMAEKISRETEKLNQLNQI